MLEEPKVEAVAEEGAAAEVKAEEGAASATVAEEASEPKAE
jgi:hypothetical protein